MFVGATTDIVPDEKSTYSNEKHIECLAMNMYHEARKKGSMVNEGTYNCWTDVCFLAC